MQPSVQSSSQNPNPFAPSPIEVGLIYVYMGEERNIPRLCKVLGTTGNNLYTITGLGGTNDEKNPQTGVSTSDLLTYPKAAMVYGDIRYHTEESILVRIISREKLNNTYTVTGPGGINDFQNPRTGVPVEDLQTFEHARYYWSGGEQFQLLELKKDIWVIGLAIARSDGQYEIGGPWSRYYPDLEEQPIVPKSRLLSMEEAEKKFGDIRLHDFGTQSAPQWKLCRIVKRNWMTKAFVRNGLAQKHGLALEPNKPIWTYDITGSAGVNDYDNQKKGVTAYERNYDGNQRNDRTSNDSLWTFEDAARKGPIELRGIPTQGTSLPPGTEPSTLAMSTMPYGSQTGYYQKFSNVKAGDSITIRWKDNEPGYMTIIRETDFEQKQYGGPGTRDKGTNWAKWQVSSPGTWVAFAVPSGTPSQYEVNATHEAGKPVEVYPHEQISYGEIEAQQVKTMLDKVLELANVRRQNPSTREPKKVDSTDPEACPGKLIMDDKLNLAAQSHCMNMAIQDFSGHKGKDESSAATRIGAVGFVAKQIGEIIAYGNSTPEGAIKSWMESTTGHRGNLLNCIWTHTGIGVYYVKDDPGSVTYRWYWTMVFAVAA